MRRREGKRGGISWAVELTYERRGRRFLVRANVERRNKKRGGSGLGRNLGRLALAA
jgi:hypothetical protein